MSSDTAMMIEQANADIRQCFTGINMLLDNARFDDHCIFDGAYRMQAYANSPYIKVIRTLNSMQFADKLELKLTIANEPSKSMIIGDTALTDELISQEDQIIVYYQDKLVQYRIKEDERVNSLLSNLQLALDQELVSIDVSLDNNNRLCLEHKQFGSKFEFRAKSTKTASISKDIGTIKRSTTGSDIQGWLNGNQCIGNGRFLISKSSNNQIPSIIFYVVKGYEKACSECVINIEDQEQYHKIDEIGKEFLTIPEISLKYLARGVDNKSNFKNLSEIAITNSDQVADALLMIHWAIEELNFLNEKWHENEKKTVSTILDLIKKSTLKETSQMLTSSFDEVKAKNMSDFLKIRLLQRQDKKHTKQNQFV